MKIFKIYNSLIPFRGYVAMTILFWVFIRKEYKDRISETTINHETIHAYQQTEIWTASAIITLLSIFLFGLSWWWLLLCPAIPIALYLLSWIIEIILPPYDMAYKNICYETEAYYNENDMEYLKKRKWFTFKFFKYISNKKYNYKNLKR